MFLLYLICFFLIAFGIGMGKFYDEPKTGPMILLFSATVQIFCFLVPAPFLNNFLTQLIVFFVILGYIMKHEQAAVWGTIMATCNAVAMHLGSKFTGNAYQEFIVIFLGACLISFFFWGTIHYAFPKMGPLPDSFPTPLIKLRQALCRHDYQMSEPLNELVYEEGCTYNLIRNHKCTHCDCETQIGSDWIYC